jgi:tRNA (guanine37-N1)-methyltransferase
MENDYLSDHNKPLFNVTILSLFPEIFPGPLNLSIAGKALSKEIWQLQTLNIRDFATDKHVTVDEKPFGGGTGMVMRADVLGNAIEHSIQLTGCKKIIYMSPRGKVFTQEKARELITYPQITILCGRYEGIDERVIEEYNIEEISIGDFILSGGEIAALTVIDACVRLLPGVIEKKSALTEESFGDSSEYSGLLEYPLYTRPSNWKDKNVPEVLLSGHHQAINKWRLTQAQEITKARRADLWEKYLNQAIK